jgi:prefoldin subunit 5
MPDDRLRFDESISVVKKDVRRIEKRVEEVSSKTNCNEVSIARIEGTVQANDERSRENRRKYEYLDDRVDKLDRASASMEAMTDSVVKNMGTMAKNMEELGGVVTNTVDRYHELDKSVMRTSIKVGIILAGLSFIAANIGAIIALFR